MVVVGVVLVVRVHVAVVEVSVVSDSLPNGRANNNRLHFRYYPAIKKQGGKPLSYSENHRLNKAYYPL